MKIRNEIPPLYYDIKKVFDFNERKTIFTYGDTLYNPAEVPITQDLIVHESTHERQQSTNPEAWWRRYMIDEQFRFEQELEAYANQYQFILSTVQSREKRHQYLAEFARHLHSPMYGNMRIGGGLFDVMKLINNYPHNKIAPAQNVL